MSPATENYTPRIVNRKVHRDYNVLERFETGIALLGTEVKSIRAGHADLTGGYAVVENDAVVLRDIHIKPFEFGHQFNHEPRRPRHLLLHQHEIKRLLGKVKLKGCALIPLGLYFNRRGKIKIELGLCLGKHMIDKRETMKRKTADREAERAMAMRRRR